MGLSDLKEDKWIDSSKMQPFSQQLLSGLAHTSAYCVALLESFYGILVDDTTPSRRKYVCKIPNHKST